LRDVVVRAENCLDEEAPGRVAGLQRRTDVAAFLQTRHRVGAETAFLLRPAMATVAVLLENRLYVPDVLHGRRRGLQRGEEPGRGEGHFPGKHRLK
jgi:hypothetical protein